MMINSYFITVYMIMNLYKYILLCIYQVILYEMEMFEEYIILIWIPASSPELVPVEKWR